MLRLDPALRPQGWAQSKVPDRATRVGWKQHSVPWLLLIPGFPARCVLTAWTAAVDVCAEPAPDIRPTPPHPRRQHTSHASLCPAAVRGRVCGVWVGSAGFTAVMGKRFPHLRSVMKSGRTCSPPPCGIVSRPFQGFLLVPECNGLCASCFGLWDSWKTGLLVVRLAFAQMTDKTGFKEGNVHLLLFD